MEIPKHPIIIRRYQNKKTKEIIEAAQVGAVIKGADNYAITLPDSLKTVGLYPEQTKSYIPETGDFYIDKGSIDESSVMKQSEFLANYTLVPSVIGSKVE